MMLPRPYEEGGKTYLTCLRKYSRVLEHGVREIIIREHGINSLRESFSVAGVGAK